MIASKKLLVAVLVMVAMLTGCFTANPVKTTDTTQVKVGYIPIIGVPGSFSSDSLRQQPCSRLRL